MKKILKKENIKKIIKYILPIIGCLTLIGTKVIDNYNIFALIILFFIYFVDLKTAKLKEKAHKKMVLGLSILFSILFVVGNLCYSNYDNHSYSVVNGVLSFSTLFNFVGFSYLFNLVLTNIYNFFIDFNIHGDRKYSSKKIFFVSWGILFICWMPYFLAKFPGIITMDSYLQLSTIIDGFKSISDHHPVVHTVLISIPYHVGYFIFGNVNAAVATITLTQMICMSAIFAYLIVFLHKRNVNYKILILVILFYGLLPIFGYYSVTLWKDVIFGAFVTLFILQLVKLIEMKEQIKIKSLIPLFFISLGFVFFRNNAIYAYLLLIPCLIIYFKGSRRLFLVFFVLVLGIYGLVKGPVYNHFNVSKSSSSEYIAIPLQQIGRMAASNVEFSDKELKLINKLIPVEVMARDYKPVLADNLKFNSQFKIEEFNENKLEYFKLWSSLVLEHPAVTFDATVASTIGYWYPNFNYWATSEGVFQNNIGITASPKVPKFAGDVLKGLTLRELPLFNMQWSIGLCLWLIVISMSICYFRNKKFLIAYLPVFMVWLTLLVASPVAGEFRYIFCAFTSLPFLLCLPFIKKEPN